MATDGGGRYDNVGEVVRFGSRLLQEAEDRRDRFRHMLRDAELEADREDAVTVDAVLVEIDGIIAAVAS